MQFAVSRQERFLFLKLSNGGWDSELGNIFNKMLELNTIYGKNFRFFIAPDKKLFTNKH
jgi:hypothetical protein